MEVTQPVQCLMKPTHMRGKLAVLGRICSQQHVGNPPPNQSPAVNSDAVPNKEGAEITTSAEIPANSNLNSAIIGEQNPAINEQLKESVNDCDPNIFGPWMLARKMQWRNPRKLSRIEDKVNSGKPTQAGSRFHILGQQE
ncbi:hypothetical protein PIB30_070453 [Stylosanthes scabra]|uniref:Uncharacterized protein n=1 Tax=Stylosanthes scabra TaxID=79078 RepID=A0ABU6QN27_9FABA|nr:hypothetical protein [Stylosanthes scabra]